MLTTWQHHFIDIPTGALLGFFALWLFPRTGASPFAGGQRLVGSEVEEGSRFSMDRARYSQRALAVVGAFGSPLWLLLLWPALALAIVAAGYAGLGASVFQKGEQGCVSLASRVLPLPYRLGARINVWAWTRKLPANVAIADGVFLGRFPTASEANGFATVIDLTAEFERPRGTTCNWISIPMLDLVTPPAERITAAVEVVEKERASASVLVCCALGFQRSAQVVAEWLVSTGRAETRGQARAMLAAAGRPVHLPDPITAEAQRA